MFYCDKCRNHLAQRHIRGSDGPHNWGPFKLDLCPRCYTEFRTLITDWTKNSVWSEADARAHSNETSGEI